MPNSSGEKSIFLTWLSPIENRLQRTFGATLSPLRYIYHGQCSRGCFWRTDILMWVFMCSSGGFGGMFGGLCAPFVILYPITGAKHLKDRSVISPSLLTRKVPTGFKSGSPTVQWNIQRGIFRDTNLNIKSASLLHITWTKKVFLWYSAVWCIGFIWLHDMSQQINSIWALTSNFPQELKWSRSWTPSEFCAPDSCSSAWCIIIIIIIIGSSPPNKLKPRQQDTKTGLQRVQAGAAEEKAT